MNQLMLNGTARQISVRTRETAVADFRPDDVHGGLSDELLRWSFAGRATL